MSDAERITELERKLMLSHEYSKRLATMLKCHDELLKIVFQQLGLKWEVVELPEPPTAIN